jgi:hypothetical protein
VGLDKHSANRTISGQAGKLWKPGKRMTSYPIPSGRDMSFPKVPRQRCPPLAVVDIAATKVVTPIPLPPPRQAQTERTHTHTEREREQVGEEVGADEQVRSHR